MDAVREPRSCFLQMWLRDYATYSEAVAAAKKSDEETEPYARIELTDGNAAEVHFAMSCVKAALRMNGHESGYNYEIVYSGVAY